MFSVLMGCGALGLTVFYNLLDFEDWKLYHNSNGYPSIVSDDDLDDGNSNKTVYKWKEWGGCRHDPGCFKVSFFVQAALCVGATLMSHRMLHDQDQLPTADAQPLLPPGNNAARVPEEEA